MHKDTKWAHQIISMQDEEGKWGSFHSLSADSRLPLTTEQALRRLEILGYTIEDDCIQRAVAYMSDCLSGQKQIPDPREKLHDWDVFTSMMLAAWIRRFTKDHAAANAVAAKWAKIIGAAFAAGEYDHLAYTSAYAEIFSMRPRGGRLIDFSQFYLVSLLVGALDSQTEAAMVRHILHSPGGIYYIYEKPLLDLPDFRSLSASRYLRAIELLAEYRSGKEQLRFVKDWLKSHQTPNGRWDMGGKAKDGIYFPLSDSWRRPELREADCTERILKLFAKIG